MSLAGSTGLLEDFTTGLELFRRAATTTSRFMLTPLLLHMESGRPLDAVG
jgi:hypothetical protein